MEGRLPLAVGVSIRDYYEDKDALAKNVFYDKYGENIYATKRPGISSYLTASGIPSGIYGDTAFVTPSYTWNASANNGSTFVVVGNKDTLDTYHDFFLVSTDSGLTWRTIQVPYIGTWTGVCWNGTVFCAVGYTGPAWSLTGITATSPDGITWTNRATSLNVINAIAADTATGRMVVVGNGNALSDPNIAYSTDNGVSWTTVTLLEGGYAYSYSGIAYCSGLSLFAIVGGGNAYKIQTSPTGVTWTDVATAPPVQRRNIAASSTTFVTLRYENQNLCDQSTNGVNWGTRTLPASHVYGDGIAWTGSHFIAVFNSSFSIAKSADGITWTQITLPSPNELVNYPSCEPATIVGNGTNTAILMGYTPEALVNYYLSTDTSASFTLTSLGITYPYPV